MARRQSLPRALPTDQRLARLRDLLHPVLFSSDVAAISQGYNDQGLSFLSRLEISAAIETTTIIKTTDAGGTATQ